MSLSIDVSVSNLDKLKQKIEYAKKIASIQKDDNFKKYIQNKCMETLNKIMDERLVGGTTNDEYIGLYKASNHIVPTADGFVIYNDASIPVEGKQQDNYPNQEFSIALAFEYGTGIVGEGAYTDDKFAPWGYNINNYNFGWYYLKDNEVLHTYGYMGFEIYRNTAIQIEKNINKWLNEYIKIKEV